MERINITRLAKEFKQNGYFPSHQFSSPIQEGHSTWSHLKPEFYALLAVVTDGLITNMFDRRLNRPPYGLINGNTMQPDGAMIVSPVESSDLDSDRPFASIPTFMHHAMIYELARKMHDDLVGNIDPEEKSIWDRLTVVSDKILASGSAPSIERYSEGGVEKLILGGLSFGAMRLQG